MRLPQLFQTGFELAQPCSLSFELELELLHVACEPSARTGRILLAQQPHQPLRELERRFQRTVLAGDFGLRGEMLELPGELLQDIVDASEVFARIFQAQLGFAAALAVF